jgi:hypothetical protein
LTDYSPLVDELVAASRHVSDTELLETLPGVLEQHNLPMSLTQSVIVRRRILRTERCRLQRVERLRELQQRYDDAITGAAVE